MYLSHAIKSINFPSVAVTVTAFCLNHLFSWLPWGVLPISLPWRFSQDLKVLFVFQTSCFTRKTVFFVFYTFSFHIPAVRSKLAEVAVPTKLLSSLLGQSPLHLLGLWKAGRAESRSSLKGLLYWRFFNQFYLTPPVASALSRFGSSSRVDDSPVHTTKALINKASHV